MYQERSNSARTLAPALVIPSGKLDKGGEVAENFPVPPWHGKG